MALMFCPDCGKEVSDIAINCPNCAYPLSKLKNLTKISSINYQNNELIVVGYIAVFLSFFLFPIFFMLIGLILGIVNLSKGAIGHGVLQIILSLVFGILGTFLGILSLLF
jgi:lipopolysaccharide export LptBFGC system permease protein LptF